MQQEPKPPNATTAMGMIVPAMSTRSANQAIHTVFHLMGGNQALLEWADSHRSEFYTKLFAKTITRQVDVKDDRSVDDLILQLGADIVPPAVPPPNEQITEVEYEDVLDDAEERV